MIIFVIAGGVAVALVVGITWPIWTPDFLLNLFINFMLIWAGASVAIWAYRRTYSKGS